MTPKNTVSLDDRLTVLATALKDLRDSGIKARISTLYHDGNRSVIIVLPGLTLADGNLTIDGAIGGGG